MIIATKCNLMLIVGYPLCIDKMLETPTIEMQRRSISVVMKEARVKTAASVVLALVVYHTKHANERPKCQKRHQKRKCVGSSHIPGVKMMEQSKPEIEI